MESINEKEVLIRIQESHIKDLEERIELLEQINNKNETLIDSFKRIIDIQEESLNTRQDHIDLLSEYRDSDLKDYLEEMRKNDKLTVIIFFISLYSVFTTGYILKSFL